MLRVDIVVGCAQKEGYLQSASVSIFLAGAE